MAFGVLATSIELPVVHDWLFEIHGWYFGIIEVEPNVLGTSSVTFIHVGSHIFRTTYPAPVCLAITTSATLAIIAAVSLVVCRMNRWRQPS